MLWKFMYILTELGQMIVLADLASFGLYVLNNLLNYHIVLLSIFYSTSLVLKQILTFVLFLWKCASCTFVRELFKLCCNVFNTNFFCVLIVFTFMILMFYCIVSLELFGSEDRQVNACAFTFTLRNFHCEVDDFNISSSCVI